MTISTPRIDRPPSALATGRGFTLAEVMIAATIAVFVLAGVFSSFLLLSRSGLLASSYSELERETRRGLDLFGTDAREACDIQWNSNQCITLMEPTPTNNMVLVTYAYDGDAKSPTFGCFYRLLGDSASTGPRLVLMHNVASDFTFQRFKLVQPGIDDNTATNDLETKQIQVTLHASRAQATAGAANQSAISACYILRNKRLTN